MAQDSKNKEWKREYLFDTNEQAESFCADVSARYDDAMHPEYSIFIFNTEMTLSCQGRDEMEDKSFIEEVKKFYNQYSKKKP